MRIRRGRRTGLYSSAFPRIKSGVRRDSPSLRRFDRRNAAGAEVSALSGDDPLRGATSAQKSRVAFQVLRALAQLLQAGDIP